VTLGVALVSAGGHALGRGDHPRTVTHAAPNARLAGPLPSTDELSVAIALKPRDAAALARYAAEVSQPGSSVFHRYLTVSQFRARFAPAPQTLRAVESALRRDGLDPGAVSANGLLVSLRAPAGELAHALHTRFARVRLRSGHTAYTNTGPVRLPAAVARVTQAVVGLNSVSAPAQPLSLVRERLRVRSSAPAAAASAEESVGVPLGGCVLAGDAYAADGIASTYGLDPLYAAGDEGAGQTVGLLEFEPDLPSDIAAYQACYGTSTVVNYTSVDGGATGAETGEAALDIEQIIGLAPAATVDVFQTANTDAGWLSALTAMLGTPGISVISISWGDCEEAATAGISVFAAAGDDGSSGCGDPEHPLESTSGLAVDDPASQPYVTGVGGTSLPDPGNAASQTVWNDATQTDSDWSGDGAGGGGLSQYWLMPSYQSQAASSLGVINAYSSGSACGAPSGELCREVPDVSADADPATGYPVYWNGDWYDVGGTSAAAPLWAAFALLVNASSACNGQALGFANPPLYSAAAHAYGADFTDIVSPSTDGFADNAFAPSLYQGSAYPVTGGYDMATGLGTPNGAALAAALCVTGDSISLAVPANQTGYVNSAITPVTSTATDTERHTVTFSAAQLPPGLGINPGTGTISGTPTTAGVYDVTITASSPVNNVSASHGFIWTIEPAAVERPVSSTITRTFHNQRLQLTRTTVGGCVTPPATATVTLTTAAVPGAHGQPVRFVSASFYVGRGVPHLHGARTTYTANAVTRTPAATVQLATAGEAAGTHTLRVVVRYEERVRREHRKVLLSVTKALNTTLRIC